MRGKRLHALIARGKESLTAEELFAFDDIGRYAATQGYDAIVAQGDVGIEYLPVLNRNSVVVTQELTGEGRDGVRKIKDYFKEVTAKANASGAQSTGLPFVPK